MAAKFDSRGSSVKPNRFLMFGLLSLLLLVRAGDLWAGTIDASVIGMFPKEASDIGYADLSQARELPWYPQFAAQVVPVALFGFEQFLRQVQMRQTSSIDEIAWASVASEPPNLDASPPSPNAARDGQTVVVATGDFDTATITACLESKNIPSTQFGSYLLYSSGAGAGSSNVFFTLLDAHTIVFGPFAPLERVLKVRDGEQDSLLQNEPMMALIESADRNAIFWGVLNSGGAVRAIDRLVPEAANFPQSRDLLGKLKEVLITVRPQDDLELDFQVETPSPNDAGLISQLLQAGVLLRLYQSKNENNSDLVNALDELRIVANGNRLEISLDLTNDQILGLIEHNTFSMKM